MPDHISDRISNLLPDDAALAMADTMTFTPTDIFTEIPADTKTPSPLPPSLTPTTTSTETPLPTNTHTVTASPTFTEGPSPTPSRTPTFTPTASRTPTATRTRYPSRTPTVTNTPTPHPVTLQISKPGGYSKVVSPFRIEAIVEPGDDGIIELELIGEDGRVISGERLDYSRYLGRRFWIAPTIEFEIPGVAETARLIMRTRDEIGRVKAISSIDLILLQLGQNEINIARVVQEPFIIRYPEEETVITGGAMWVSGLVRRVNPNPLILELMDEQGNVVGMNTIEIPAPNDEMSHIPFGIEIFYTVPETTSALLVVRQESDQRLGGTVALSTIPLILEP